jgi:hypothetical protein
MDTPSSSSDRDPLERLAAEFLERRRRGENPSPSQYAEKYPQWAEQIVEFFPAREAMEGLKPGTDDGTGSFEDRAHATGLSHPEQLRLAAGTRQRSRDTDVRSMARRQANTSALNLC